MITLKEFLDDTKVAFDNGFGKAESIFKMYNALAEVMELHKRDGGLCNHCEEGFIMGSLPVVYPCPTIQAIEKELQ